MNNNNNNTMLTTSTSITLSSSSSLNDNNENNNENENNENSLIQLENIMKELQKNILCGICLDDIKDSRSLNCSHTFCNNCILEVFSIIYISLFFFSLLFSSFYSYSYSYFDSFSLYFS